jgi:hypothetical protein
VLGAGVLVLVVAEPAEALHEQHRRGHAGAGRLGGVVQRSAEQSRALARQLHDHLAGQRNQPLVERARRDPMEQLPLGRHALLAGDALAGFARIAEHPLQHLRLGVA